jgi:cytochrome b pre-mRNA-processing protein 3
MIFARWRGRRADIALSRAVYERIVAQARRPAFYARLGVPDTPDGRFEMLALHLFLVLHRLKRERGDPATAALAQRLVDHLIADLDANLREMGAGDLGVGRRVKRMAGAVYGRIAAYEAGLGGGEAALSRILRQTVLGTTVPTDEQLAALVRYFAACCDLLAGRTADDLARGAIDFPVPADDDRAAGA